MHVKIVLTCNGFSDEIIQESVWAVSLNGMHYEIDSIPFFAPNIALGDVVTVESEDGLLHFDDFVKSSGNSTLQIVFFEKDYFNSLVKELESDGCTWEGYDGGYLSVNVPSDINYGIVKRKLLSYSGKKLIDFREACLSEKHLAESFL